MFLGEFNHTVDNKGRMFVPACYRDQLVGKFYVSRTEDKCVKLYSKPEWDKFCARFENIPGEKNTRSSRFIFRYAYEVELDSSGRLLIPEKLREHAEIKKDVVIIGRNTLAEIWDSALFEKYVEQEDQDAIMDYINEAGIPT